MALNITTQHTVTNGEGIITLNILDGTAPFHIVICKSITNIPDGQGTGTMPPEGTSVFDQTITVPAPTVVTIPDLVPALYKLAVQDATGQIADNFFYIFVPPIVELNGSVMSSDPVALYFQFGPNEGNYPNTIPAIPASVPASTSPIAVKAYLGSGINGVAQYGLTDGEEIHFRIKATDGIHTDYGDDMVFQTAEMPTIMAITLPASGDIKN